VRGAEPCKLLFKINCMMNNMMLYDNSLLLIEFHVSGIFLETVWRVMNCR